MILMLVGIGLFALLIMVGVEAGAAYRERRERQTGIVVLAGLVGMTAFLGIVIASDLR